LQKKNFILLVLLLISINISAKDVGKINNNHWAQLNLYKGIQQRGGPYSFDDTYLELEFGGRYKCLQLYGYIDYLDVLNDSGSDKHGQDNFFVDIEPRISLDYLFNKDLSYGAVKELYLAFDIYYADTPPGLDKGLKVLWMGLGSDIDIPWLGLSGVNVYARYIEENYGANNEHSFDGYVAHINWFKPLKFFPNDTFVAFQGYADYEFLSNLEDAYRTNDSFQAYLGVWFHAKKYALGYGLKGYKNMTQWKDDINLGANMTDTTGFAHYFNITYKF